MPHSSGGGSHGGGSHGGGSSGSRVHGRRGGSGTHISHNHFPGAYRYVGYKDGQPDYIYCNSPNLPEQSRSLIGSLILLLFYIPFIWAGIHLGTSAVHIPHKMDASYNPTVAIVDEEDRLSDTDEKFVKKGATAVYEATGVPVCVRFEDNSVWKEKYPSLENYAYDAYLDMYDDEDHWLIVYTDNQKTKAEDDGYLDWYFEGMQGDNTDKYLPKSLTSTFNKNLHDALIRHDGNIGQSFDESFEELAKNAGKVSFNKSLLPFAFFWNIFTYFHMFFMVFRDPTRKYKDYTLCDDEDYETIRNVC